MAQKLPFRLVFACILFFLPTVFLGQNALPIQQYLDSERALNPQPVGMLPVERLMNGVNPVINAENGNVKIYGADPTVLQADASQIITTLEMGLPTETVVLLTVKIRSASDLAATLDASELMGKLPALQFIHILSESQIPAESLATYIQNAPASLDVFYSIYQNN